MDQPPKSSPRRASESATPSRPKGRASRVPHPISAYMTEAPHSIGIDQPLATAHTMMRAHRIRHLPVLRAGKLVGILSQRDLLLVETLRDVDPKRVPVEEAMTEQAYWVTPNTSVDRVAATMAAKKYGCAVVMEDDEVVGVFTATDALKALAEILRGAPGRS